ncbi:hypothetical protein [Tenacibaculum maritimum]|uniref:hypothetical protein n=1 Tax=Tenacibaculum maritimum TaxID=107401 RepID=UPI0038907B4C
MKKIILLVFSIFVLTGYQQKKEKKVFICKTVTSTRYHLKPTCKGLKKCKAIVKKVAVDKAKKVGRVLCKWEVKK